MVYASADAPPTWYRLSPESWAEIRRDYQNGATARELAGRWRVSASSIYRHACEEGWTKKNDGDAKARAHAGAVAAEEQADLEGAWPGVKGKALGASAIADLLPPRLVANMPEDGTQLAAVALGGAGRAMRLGRLREAQELAKLADLFGRLAARDLEHRIETLYLAATSPGFIDEAMSLEGDPDPHPLKQMYWAEKKKRAAAAG